MSKIVLILIFIGSVSWADIMGDCQKKWGTDYSMVKYCVDKQTAAKRNVSSLPDNNIMKKCTEKWRADHTMVKYCYEKQAEAKRSLGL